jgi:hypothetical protein
LTCLQPCALNLNTEDYVKVWWPWSDFELKYTVTFKFTLSWVSYELYLQNQSGFSHQEWRFIIIHTTQSGLWLVWLFLGCALKWMQDRAEKLYRLIRSLWIFMTFIYKVVETPSKSVSKILFDSPWFWWGSLFPVCALFMGLLVPPWAQAKWIWLTWLQSNLQYSQPLWSHIKLILDITFFPKCLNGSTTFCLDQK